MKTSHILHVKSVLFVWIQQSNSCTQGKNWFPPQNQFQSKLQYSNILIIQKITTFQTQYADLSCSISYYDVRFSSFIDSFQLPFPAKNDPLWSKMSSEEQISLSWNWLWGGNQFRLKLTLRSISVLTETDFEEEITW